MASLQIEEQCFRWSSVDYQGLNTDLGKIRSRMMSERNSSECGPYRIASFPGPIGENAYVRLFYDALKPYGVQLVHPAFLRQQWIRQNTHNLHAVHVHWLEGLCGSYMPRLMETLCQQNVCGMRRLSNFTKTPRKLPKLLRFAGFLRSVKRHGLRLIWTCHNIEPHTRADTVDWFVYNMVARQADLVIVHSESARDACISRFAPRGQLVVMKHGNYEGVFPSPRPRTEILRQLGLREDLPVACCIGGLRRSKGFDIAAAALHELDGQAQLIIAGNAGREFGLDALRAALEGTSAVLICRHVSDQEIADFVSASDVILLPYRGITGSGVLLAAWTLGRGVVASRLPFFQEMLSDAGNAGVLVSPNDPKALAAGIERYLRLPVNVREAAARELADRYQWSKVITPVGKILHRWARVIKSPTYHQEINE